MFRLILYLILFITIYWVVKRALSLPKKKTPNPLAVSEELVQDPVCHCYVPKNQSFAVSLNGQKFFFCSEECYKKYLADPLRKS